MHRRAVTATAVVGLAILLAGCATDPAPRPSVSTPSTATSAPPAPSPSPTPTATDTIAVPGRCENIYSPAMLASLTAQSPPLNDPGVTMYSTQNADALDLLGSGVPTLRCSWGKPSSVGLATNVSIVTTAQIVTLRQSFQNQGFACSAAHGGTLCVFAQEMPSGDATFKLGEYQFFRGNGWVSTRWITFNPTGYTDDIIATLWG